MAVVGEMECDRMKEVKKFEESKMGIKGLVDSGITSIPGIFPQLPKNTIDLKPSAASSDLRAPIIDLSGLNSSDRRSQIVDEIKEACRTWGIFQVINHGIPLQVMEEAIKAVRSFHEQPVEMKKQSLMMGENVSFYSDFNPFNSKVANWKDTLRLKLNQTELENVPMVCRKELVAWDKQLLRLGESLMELLCEGLGVRSGRLKELSCLDARTMTCHYYPYCPQPDMILGLKSHTDKLLLTLLLKSMSNDSGLQVMYNGDWVDHHPIHGAITVNVGDLLELISNGEYKSIEHRVVANSSQDPNISIALFFSPTKSGDTDYYGPLPELVTPTKPALYQTFTMPIYLEAISKYEYAGDKTFVSLFKLQDVKKEAI